MVIVFYAIIIVVIASACCRRDPRSQAPARGNPGTEDSKVV